MRGQRIVIINRKKRCSQCKKLLPLTLKFFRQDIRMSWGFRSACKKCLAPYDKKRKSTSRKERAIWVSSFKKKCFKCGYNKNPIALDFHHKEKTKKLFGIGSGSVAFYKSKDTVLAEIRKCIVLCANCHRIETWRKK